MVSFRHVVAGTDVNHWWDNGANAIAFSRGTKGFVAINDGTAALDTTVTTGMTPGTYLDLLTSNPVVVDATGAVHFTLSPRSAIAIDTVTRQ
jgi:alpha-amylase